MAIKKVLAGEEFWKHIPKLQLPVQQPEIWFGKLENELDQNQYFHDLQIKKYIFLHHTAGWDAQSAIQTWDSNPERVATPYLIERDGTIIQNYDDKKWAYALGVKGATFIEKASIHIELVALGKLIQENARFYFRPIPGTKGKEIPKEEVVILPKPFRDCYYYHKYTDYQIQSLKYLLLYLTHKHSIEPQGLINNFYFGDPSFVKKPYSGIFSHTTVRMDKSDIFPQPNLINLISSLKDLYP